VIKIFRWNLCVQCYFYLCIFFFDKINTYFWNTLIFKEQSPRFKKNVEQVKMLKIANEK
jgi:hypothetical protein